MSFKAKIKFELKKILFSLNKIVADKLPCPLRGPLNRRYKQWHAIEKIHFSTKLKNHLNSLIFCLI